MTRKSVSVRCRNPLNISYSSPRCLFRQHFIHSTTYRRKTTSTQPYKMRWLFKFLFLGSLMQTIISAANNGFDLPGQLLNALLDHFRDMKGFFCPYCIEYCLTGEQPPLPPGSGPSARQPPRLPFDHWDPFAMVIRIIPSSCFLTFLKRGES